MRNGWKPFRELSWRQKLFLLALFPAATLWAIAVNAAYLVGAASAFWYGRNNAGNWRGLDD